MAAKTPVLTRSTTGYTDPGRSFRAGAGNSGSDLTSVSGNHNAGREGTRLQIFYFDDIDATDTWVSGIKDIRAVAWQAQDAVSDAVGVALLTQSTGTISLQAENANSSGWLWVLSGGAG